MLMPRIAAFLLVAGSLLAAQIKTAPTPPPLLPDSFNGWQKAKDPAHGTSAQAADAANATFLAESGFADFESAAYTRDGRTIQVKGLRFADATGAYAAFTHYRQPAMAKENFCDAAASEQPRVIFFCKNVFVDATYDKITAMTSAELRALAATIPTLTGPAAQPPLLPLYLPESVRRQGRFSLGRAGYDASDPAMPSAVVDFSRTSEVVVARFRSDAGLATATLLRFPTPAIATQEQAKIDAWSKTRETHPDPERLDTANSKRTGPLVALVTGNISDVEARELLERINYDATISWTEPTGLEPKNNIGGIVYNATLLAIIIFLFAVVVGFVFGGFRALLRKLFPNRFHDPAEGGDFISLDIDR
ncbi:MAG: hypothetical protein HYX26_02890 [Acidobacteriales bacterium]|nr:hypothetical protein [Terriglobales bacterium]